MADIEVRGKLALVHPLTGVVLDATPTVTSIQGLRPDGTLPTVAVGQVEQIARDAVATAPVGMPATGVPIFPTLAEAQTWEAANPGRVALTLEGEGGGGPGPDPDPDPGVVVASDDFSHADGYITGLPTPVGNRMWVQDTESEVINWPGSTAGFNFQPNVRGGRYVNGAGYIETGLSSLKVSFDYHTVGTGTPVEREVRVGVGGYVFYIVNELNLYRMFAAGDDSKLIKSISAGGTFKPSGHCEVEYDGLTAIMRVDGDVVLDHTGDGRTNSRVGLVVRGAGGIGTADPGTVGSLTGNWVDNLVVESL